MKVQIEGLLNYVETQGVAFGNWDVDNTSLLMALQDAGLPVAYEISKSDPYHLYREYGRVRITIEVLDPDATMRNGTNDTTD